MLSNTLPVFLGVRRTYLVPGVLILAAWALLAAWQRSAYAGLLSHEVMGDLALTPLLRLAAFLLGWSLMTVAMMLPGSLPMLNHTAPRSAVQRRMLLGLQAALPVFGYLILWTVFGLLAYLGDGFVHRLASPGMPLAAFSAAIAPAVVLVAGIYQFTPAKRLALEYCRPSHSSFASAGTETLSAVRALQHGLRLGAFCIGSCWPLMLLMFAVGHHRLDWMLVLSGIMAAERLAPWGRRLSWLVGLALILWAAFWLLGPLPVGHSHS